VHVLDLGSRLPATQLIFGEPVPAIDGQWLTRSPRVNHWGDGCPAPALWTANTTLILCSQLQ